MAKLTNEFTKERTGTGTKVGNVINMNRRKRGNSKSKEVVLSIAYGGSLYDLHRWGTSY